MPRPLSAPGKGPVPIVQEAGWSPRPVWTDAENLAPTGINGVNFGIKCPVSCVHVVNDVRTLTDKQRALCNKLLLLLNFTYVTWQHGKCTALNLR
jgi:hypothetical protein